MDKSLRAQVVEFAIENKESFSWKEIAERFSLPTDDKTLKRMSDWTRFYKTTGLIEPSLSNEDIVVEVSERNSDDIVVPEGFKVSKMWQNSGGKMLYSFEKVSSEEENSILKVLETFQVSDIKVQMVEKENKCGLVIFFTDAHLNKLSLDGKSPEQKCEKYYELLVKTVNTAKKYHQIDTICYIVGSDMFNSDTYFNTTTNGTPQDNTLHFDKAFELGLNLNINSINYLLSNSNNVEIVQLSGNHDLTTSFYLAKTLEAYYRNEPRCVFNSASSIRKCITLGNTSIMLHHGNLDLKYVKDIFANFFPKEYTNKFIECFVGDKHFAKSYSDGRLNIRQFPTLSTSDKWTDSKSYYNVPGILAEVYDFEDGRILEIDLKA